MKKHRKKNGFAYLTVLIAVAALSLLCLEASRLVAGVQNRAQKKMDRVRDLYRMEEGLALGRAVLPRVLAGGSFSGAAPLRLERDGVEILIEDESGKISLPRLGAQNNAAFALLCAALERLYPEYPALAREIPARLLGPGTPPLRRLGQLRAVAPVEKNTFARMRRELTPLPTAGININTAPARVLSAISPWIDAAALQRLETLRTGDGRRISKPTELANLLPPSAVEELKTVLVFDSDGCSITCRPKGSARALRLLLKTEKDAEGKTGLRPWLREEVWAD